MATHFLDMGFNEQISDEELWDILVKRIENARETNCTDGITVNAMGEYTFFTLLIDDSIELWYKTLVNKSSITAWEDFEMHYNTHRVQIMEGLKWVYEDEVEAIFQGFIKDCDYPLNIQVVDKLLFPKIEEDMEYNVEIVCFANDVQVYKTAEEFFAHHKMMSPKSIIPMGTFSLDDDEEVQTSDVWMNGIIKRVERKINSYTGNAYYHLLIESLDADYDVLVAESLINKELKEDYIVSVHGWLSGFIYGGVENYFPRIEKNPKTEEEFHEIIEKRLMALIPSIPYDCITVDIENPKEMDGITFIQAACYDEGKYLLEIGKNRGEKNCLYRLDELDLKSIINLFRETCLFRKIPDLTNWEDVTEILAKDKVK
jgi:hypothetical protein